MVAGNYDSLAEGLACIHKFKFEQTHTIPCALHFAYIDGRKRETLDRCRVLRVRQEE